MDLAKAMEATWDLGAGGDGPSGVGGEWNGQKGGEGTGEALLGPEPAGIGSALAYTGDPGKWSEPVTPGNGRQPRGSRRGSQ